MKLKLFQKINKNYIMKIEDIISSKNKLAAKLEMVNQLSNKKHYENN